LVGGLGSEIGPPRPEAPPRFERPPGSSESLRFGFGRNWRSFSEKALTPESLAAARAQFAALLDGIELEGRTFLDIGFGQGLPLVFARERGAEVLGIDIDPDNVLALRATSRALGLPAPPPHRIVSILNPGLPREYPRGFRVVHSWGVLHHTGDMRAALEAACRLVAEGGIFICSIYNRHWSSPIWSVIKRTYNSLPAPARSLLVWSLYPVIYAAKFLVTGRNPRRMRRGMDFYHNVVDWVGGYPYEYAGIDEIKALVEPLGFALRRAVRAEIPIACNEFVFERIGARPR
jgi:2-polyprenyl-6-hydroxyphenyl methylase/3-demethylubiquinone-9 3-methyltransferase